MRCQICAKRKQLIAELDKIEDSDKREGARKREGVRTPIIDTFHMCVVEEGKRDELDECCRGVVGSISETIPGSKKQEHNHRCSKCGKRFPTEGNYEGEYVNDDLRRVAEA